MYLLQPRVTPRVIAFRFSLVHINERKTPRGKTRRDFRKTLLIWVLITAFQALGAFAQGRATRALELFQIDPRRRIPFLKERSKNFPECVGDRDVQP